ncbi:MAG: capsular biosynthesis protein CpsH [Lachnospiraceae bacterium]|nr:capsular biosynthesis protein CpsH [Lachnospiraceae bacterium]
MADDLKGKRILFFCQYFFGYEEKIARKYRELGAEVDLYDERSVKKTIERAFLKVLPEVFHQKTEKYYAKILKEIKTREYNYILFIDCEMPTEKVLRAFRRVFPKAKFCLHLWDSIKNLKGVEKKFSYFDYITSFDRADARDYAQIKFRPLFFCDEFRAGAQTLFYDYDLCFIGTIHSDRYKVIKALSAQTEHYGLKMYCYPYLQSRFIFYYYKIMKKEFRGTKADDFKFEKKSAADIADIVSRSRVIADVQHPGQTGLTMRTLEMVGMKKKLITTNQDIVNYDFYRKNNIMVINRSNVKCRKEFFETGYEEIPEQTYEYYSAARWCMDVLGLKNE